ncbi:MAG: hypothetical protein HOC70_11510 [Gammaproteobacteria bacterium]|jgi:virginiamycin B lyase|nr:hypothetical protein [Gammaproteobacteria bacterium]MBT4493861.1 hypothetical protein [Gammaproteobacteria bacterium]
MGTFRFLIVLIAFQSLVPALVRAAGVEALSPITEYPLPESLSSPYAIELDASSRVWFTEKVGQHLAMFDPKDEQFRVHKLPESWGKVGPAQLAITDAGEIWFTIHRWAEDAAQTNVLGKFSPSTNSFTRYEISLDASPQEIVIGEQGMLWLVAADRNQLLKVDAGTGKVVSYQIPTPDSNPQGLTIDHKGDVWFSEPNVNKIGRFSPNDGYFKEFDIPTAFANPGSMAVDVEGKVWFVERSSNRLGVLYPDLNRFDEALIPTLNALPHAIDADGQGRLWFLEYRGNKVGVFDPQSATFNEFDIPRYNSFPGEMVIDHEQNLIWFTESNAESSQLGVLSIGLAGLPSKSGQMDDIAEATKTVSNGVANDYLVPVVGLVLLTILLGTGVWATTRSGEVG